MSRLTRTDPPYRPRNPRNNIVVRFYALRDGKYVRTGNAAWFYDRERAAYWLTSTNPLQWITVRSPSNILHNLTGRWFIHEQDVGGYCTIEVVPLYDTEEPPP